MHYIPSRTTLSTVQKLSVVSMGALLVVGCVLALAIFVHPISTALQANPSPAGSATAGNAATGSNSTLLTQPPPTSGTGDDGGTYGDDG